jgi:hypothetical protein
VLMESTTPDRAVAASRRLQPASRIDTQRAWSPASAVAASRQKPEFAYLCRASDTLDRALPIGYYIANVFKTSDDQDVVERRWREFLVATYPYKFANNRHASAQCIRLIDPAVDLNALKKPDVSGNAEIVETRWHYTLGPPPSPVSVPLPPTPPARDTR